MTGRLPVFLDCFWDIQNLHIFVVCEGLVAIKILKQKLTYHKTRVLPLPLRKRTKINQ